MNSRWDLARQLLIQNETIVSLNLPELAGGDSDLLDRMELICLCPLLPNSELEALLVQHPRRMPFPKFDVDAAIGRSRTVTTTHENRSSNSSNSSKGKAGKSDFNIRGIQCHQKAAFSRYSAATFATTATQRNPATIAANHGLSLDEFMAASDKDWPRIKDDPAMLETLAWSIQTRSMRELGKIPSHYTATTVCVYCGPVPIFPGVGERVKGCPWCFNRIRGVPVPRATRDC